MKKQIHIGIAGLGTVGSGVVEVLQKNQALLAARSGVELQVSAVSARNKNQQRAVSLDGLRWVDNAVDLAKDPAIDLVVEVIGGSEGIAHEVCETALKHKKHVVTANKALIAHHGVKLAQLAEDNGVKLTFEAAVAGGIPIVKSLKEGLAANRIQRVCGIMNGTCNYILTSMLSTGRDFSEVLKEAQDLGYAEADPSFDIDGIDTAHKLAILTSLAYGTPVNIDNMYIEGIRHITLSDIIHAEELGYKIKLLGICDETEHGIEQRVHPCMVPADTPIASVDGVFNAVFVEGDFVGKTMFEGPGAGMGATASAVVADIVDIASGRASHPFNVPVKSLSPKPFAPISERKGEYYIRLAVLDKPGVMADITAILRDEQISLEAVQQKAHKPDEPVDLVLVTHETPESAMKRALDAIGALPTVTKMPYTIRIEIL